MLSKCVLEGGTGTAQATTLLERTLYTITVYYHPKSTQPRHEAMHGDLEILCLDCVEKINLSSASHENLRTPASCLMQGFWAFPPWTFLAGWFFVEGWGVLCVV